MNESKTESQQGLSQIVLPILLAAAIALTVFLVQQSTNLIPHASDPGVCRNDPMGQDDAGQPNSRFDEFYNINNYCKNDEDWSYKWEADCSKKCGQNSDCPKNTGNSRINPDTSNWCYGFSVNGTVEGRCMMLTDNGNSLRDTYCNSDGTVKSSGSKDIGKSCDKGSECKSGVCTNGKCVQGTEPNGSSCDFKDECQSKICTNNKCASSGTNNTTNNTNNTTGGGGGGGGQGTDEGLTKAEITGFKTNYDSLDGLLGSGKESGNLKIVSGIAKSELDSIVSQLPQCPDDDKVKSCLEKKFGKRFDFAKTAARLSAFYAIFNGIGNICVKSDFGLEPLISAQNGRVALCSDSQSSKVWKIFSGGSFSPIDPGNTGFPSNPTCATLPENVLSHYRDAEKLFKKEEGFVEKTACDGKTAETESAKSSPKPSKQ